MPLVWTREALLSLSELPGLAAKALNGVDNLAVPKGLGQMPSVWTDPALPICLSQAQEGAGALVGVGIRGRRSTNGAWLTG